MKLLTNLQRVWKNRSRKVDDMWSRTKKRLSSFLCDSLKGRVDYHCSNYRIHDGIGRTYITVDGKEIYNMCTLKRNYYGNQNDGCYSQVEFMESLEMYFDSAIEQILESDDEMIKILSILDRRVGKRTLLKLLDEYESEEKIIKYFIDMRCDAEGLRINKNVNQSKRHLTR